jgi:hypothetical protein
MNRWKWQAANDGLARMAGSMGRVVGMKTP